MSRAKSALLAAFALCVAACGGGGGGGDSARPDGQPTIQATMISFPDDAVPAGFASPNRNTLAAVTVLNQDGSAPITTASVTINGVALSYSTDYQDYEGELTLEPGAAVSLSVNVNGTGYAVSTSQFYTYPTITTPAANTTWLAQSANLVSWSGTAPSSTAEFALGLLDLDGNIVWPPAEDALREVSSSERSYSIPENMLGNGSRLLLVGVVDFVAIAGATPGSGLVIGGFNYAPIEVASGAPPPSATLESLVISPAAVTVGLSKTRQVTVTGTYSNENNVDLTTQATWSSSDPTKVGVSGAGLVTGVATGSAVVTAEFGGLTATANVNVFRPNPSPLPPLSESVTYQIDYAHSGRATVGASGPVFPPTAQWSTTLNGNASYPLIAQRKVFVMTNTNPTTNGATNGTSLYALDETSGTVVWGPVEIPGNYGWAGHAYDHGRVFVINFNGVLSSFDAATGAAGWSEQLPGQYMFTSPPTAVNGVVYVGGSGDGGTLYAVDENDGGLLWTAAVLNGDHSSPAVSDDGVFVSYPCQVYKLDPLVGTPLWRYNGPCEGGGGRTPAVGNGRVYVRDAAIPPNRIFDASTGAQVGTFSSTTTPALSGNSVFFLDSGTLSAVDAAMQSARWTFAGDGGLAIAPIVIDSVVVAGSTTGAVYALDANTGTVLWTGQAGAPLSGPDEQDVASPLVGLGAGDGYLVVPAGNVIKSWKIVR